MNAVFLDTVGLIALWDTSDQWHEAATAAFATIKSSNAQLLTTTFVLLECGNAAARRPYRGAVARLRVQMEQGGALIVPTANDWAEAWVQFSQGSAGDAGIVDCVSFCVMRRLGVKMVFTNDAHFRAAGFEPRF